MAARLIVDVPVPRAHRGRLSGLLRRRPRTVPVRWPNLVWAAGAVLLARHRRGLGLPRPLSRLVAGSVPAAVAAAAPRAPWRHAATWGAHMWAYKVCFEIPYDDPDDLRERLRVRYPLRADTVLGAGRPPGERLQRALRRPLEITWLDRALTAVYLFWEAEPHLALGWILLRRPDRFPAAAARLAAAYDLTLFGYSLVPTAPPWWASEKEGLMGGRLVRVTTRVMRDLRGQQLEQDDVEGSNPWASMPSDHFGSAATTAMLLSELDRRLGAAAWAYALALGFALVYHGEHYVTDLLAGLALAESVRRIEPAARPLGRRLSELWARVEPG